MLISHLAYTQRRCGPLRAPVWWNQSQMLGLTVITFTVAVTLIFSSVYFRQDTASPSDARSYSSASSDIDYSKIQIPRDLAAPVELLWGVSGITEIASEDESAPLQLDPVWDTSFDMADPSVQVRRHTHTLHSPMLSDVFL